MIKDKLTLIAYIVGLAAITTIVIMRSDAMSIIPTIVAFVAGLFAQRPSGGTTPPASILLVGILGAAMSSCGGSQITADPVYSGSVAAETHAGTTVVEASGSVEYGMISGDVSTDVAIEEGADVLITTSVSFAIMGQTAATVMLSCEGSSCEICLMTKSPMCYEFGGGGGDEQ